MPAPINISEATAIDIPTLPASISQNVVFSGVTYTVFYKHTPPNDGNIGLFGFGDLVTYRPTTRVYTETSPGVYTQLLGIAATNKAIQFPVVAGTTYYFKFTTNGGNPSPALLLIEIELFTQQAVPDNSILVNDDTADFPGVVVSGVNGDDYTTLRFINDMAAGEGGDIIRSTGNVLLEDIRDSTCKLYDENLAEIATVAFTPSGAIDNIRAQQILEKFYCSNATSGPAGVAQVQIVGNDGTLETTYNFPAAGLTAIAANNDGSIIYNAGQGGSVGAAIKRFDTATQLQLTDLVAGISNYIISSLVVVSDDTILAIYRKFSGSPHDIFVNHYATDGSLLDTYPIVADGDSGPRLQSAIDDPNSFWAWIVHNSIATFGNIKISDGSILAVVNHVIYESGVYDPAETASPIARFGISQSCPFIVLNAVPSSLGTIIVTKVTVPSDSTDFDFTAGGGLSPGSFTLADGESQNFPSLTPATGYSIVETPNALYTTVYSVSNGTPHTNISVAAGETVTVTVTNTLKATGIGGIYKMVPSKRQDTLYVTISPVTTQDVKIP